MRQERVDRDGDRADVRFELPPRLSERADRRMASRAEAAWRAIGGGQLPRCDQLDFGADSAFTAHALLLDLRRGERVDVMRSGDAIEATFGISPGALSGSAEGMLAGPLLDACELLRLTQSTVPIEGTLIGLTNTYLLTRGIVLPLADNDGRLGFAQCVLNWKELLDRQAIERLRSEFTTAFRRISAKASARSPLWHAE